MSQYTERLGWEGTHTRRFQVEPGDLAFIERAVGEQSPKEMIMFNKDAANEKCTVTYLRRAVLVLRTEVASNSTFTFAHEAPILPFLSIL